MAYGSVNVPGSLTPEDTGAAPVSHTHSKSQITDFPASMPASDVPAWAKAASKPTYTASEVGAAAANHGHTAAAVGAAPASHTHSRNQITDFPASLPASDVYPWAKAASKPAYTAGEVGAAAANHGHTVDQISGVLPIDKGGTGGTTGRVIVGQSSAYTLGNYATSEGFVTIATGDAAHAEGWQCKATGSHSHAEGFVCEATGSHSHAEGAQCKAIGSCAHAEGNQCTATGNYSHAAGNVTVAEYKSETVIGYYNVQKNPSDNNAVGDLFVVGKGSNINSRANMFRVATTGIYGAAMYNSTGADYAELFEWLDGNTDNADRCGLFVTLDGDKIRIATPEDDYILGIISGDPSVVGDVHDDQWKGMYLYDVFGRPIWEDVEVPAETAEMPDPENPEQTVTQVIIPAHTEHRQKLNPDYDHTQRYIPRSERPEWDAVGMMGKLVAVDDGTCQVNGWCTVGEGGVATRAQERTKYRVMARLDDTHIRVLMM